MKSTYAIVAGVMLGGWCSDRQPVSKTAEVRSAVTSVVSEAAGLDYDPEAIRRVRSGVAAERQGDSATAHILYQQAIADLPPIADWLRLRTASLSSDSTERSLLYRAVSSQPAAAQIGLIEARVRERLGDTAGAILARARLGQTAEVYRLRLAAAPLPGPRAAVIKDIVRFATDSASSPLASAVAASALPFRQTLSGSENLALARASSVALVPSQVVAFYTRARERRAEFTPADRFRFGEALSGLSRNREAGQEFARVTAGPLAPRALLAHGRSLIRAGNNGRSLLEQLVRRYPRDTTATPAAFALLGDLARDAGSYDLARQRWKSVGKGFPTSASAPRARFLAALVLWTHNRYAEAAGEWDALYASPNAAEEADAAEYWAGRAWSRAGDSVRARARWQSVRSRSPLSYYAGLSSKRLGLSSNLQMVPGADTFPRVEDVHDARDRLSLLAETGLASELVLETRWLASQAGDQMSRVLATADLLRRFNRGSAATQLGWRALSEGDTTSRTYRLIFPLLYGPALSGAAERGRVDPALVAGLIRQESLFDSMATSRAGARGLMQVMPSVGRSLARSLGHANWHPDSLYLTSLNLELGSRHLASALAQYGKLERTLAAYNAGGSRVLRWARYPGADDPETFVEWIPFRETRTYVRTVLRNREFYRALYVW